jgi:hypothetical protein
MSLLRLLLCCILTIVCTSSKYDRELQDDIPSAAPTFNEDGLDGDFIEAIPSVSPTFNEDAPAPAPSISIVETVVPTAEIKEEIPPTVEDPQEENSPARDDDSTAVIIIVVVIGAALIEIAAFVVWYMRPISSQRKGDEPVDSTEGSECSERNQEDSAVLEVNRVLPSADCPDGGNVTVWC